MTLAKICGITTYQDARLAVQFGADELGFNFYAESPRYVAVENAAAIVSTLPVGVGKIGVFVNEEAGRILAAAQAVGLTGIQLHGDETPEFVASLRERTDALIIKAFRVGTEFSSESINDFDADAVLLDAHSKEGYGGTGEVFDWQLAAMVERRTSKLYLAGGLSEFNVAKAIATVNPYCVDACSLIESEPGVKDENKLRNFLVAVGKSS